MAGRLGSEQSSALELGAFSLLRGLGLAVLARALEFLLLCRDPGTDPACQNLLQHAQQVYALRDSLESQIVELSSGYSPDTGARSAVIRAGRNVRSDLDRFATAAAGLTDGLSLLDRMTELAKVVGDRTRMLAHMLGMHYWVRTLVVPGRGAPVFILHDEYTSWLDMVNTLVGIMVRNGQQVLTMAEIGISSEAYQVPLLQAHAGLQYIGIALDSSEEESSELRQGRYSLYQQAKEYLQPVATRSVLHYTSSASLAAAVPREALDLVLLDIGSGVGNVAQDLELWEARVKPGGILAARNFGPSWPEGLGAVCSRRFSNDIHLSVGGGLWWYVEPEEE